MPGLLFSPAPLWLVRTGLIIRDTSRLAGTNYGLLLSTAYLFVSWLLLAACCVAHIALTTFWNDIIIL